MNRANKYIIDSVRGALKEVPLKLQYLDNSSDRIIIAFGGDDAVLTRERVSAGQRKKSSWGYSLYLKWGVMNSGELWFKLDVPESGRSFEHWFSITPHLQSELAEFFRGMTKEGFTDSSKGGLVNVHIPMSRDVTDFKRTELVLVNGSEHYGYFINNGSKGVNITLY